MTEPTAAACRREPSFRIRVNVQQQPRHSIAPLRSTILDQAPTMQSESYARNCLCLMSVKAEDRQHLEKIFDKVSAADVCYRSRS